MIKDMMYLPLSPEYEEAFFKHNGYQPRWIPTGESKDGKRLWSSNPKFTKQPEKPNDEQVYGSGESDGYGKSG